MSARDGWSGAFYIQRRKRSKSTKPSTDQKCFKTFIHCVRCQTRNSRASTEDAKKSGRPENLPLNLTLVLRSKFAFLRAMWSALLCFAKIAPRMEIRQPFDLLALRTRLGKEKGRRNFPAAFIKLVRPTTRETRWW